MASIALFSISLFGLAAIFGCKLLELGGNTRTPLTTLRRVGDPLLVEGWEHLRERVKKTARAGLRAAILWIAATARKTQVAFDTTVHGIAARLNRYLRTRRLHLRRNGEVSAHLKTVLEKTEKDVEPPSSTSP